MRAAKENCNMQLLNASVDRSRRRPKPAQSCIHACVSKRKKKRKKAVCMQKRKSLR